MLFLMNDVVLDLSQMKLTPRLTAHRFRALAFPSIIRMGQELYAETPLLHLERPARAMRLAALIQAKAPSITAALFVAPAAGVDPDEVTVRFAEPSRRALEDLHDRQEAGALDMLTCDRQVWRRLAA
jgi:hypothetical protein